MPAIHRLLALLASTSFGAGVGVVGHWATGSQWWYLAVPGCVAAAWLFVADPTQCVSDRPPASRRPR